MAAVFRLSCDTGGTADLLGNAGGTLLYRVENWQSTLTSENATEVIGLVGQGTDAAIMASVQVIDELTDQARQYWNAAEAPWRSPVWFEYNAATETAKRALVSEITLQPVVVGQYTPLLGKAAAFYQLTVTRSTIWEDSASAALRTASLACNGGVAALAPIDGSYPARIFDATFDPAGAASLGKCWLGIRPALYGTATFVAPWTLSGRTAGYDSESTTAGGTAVMQCTFKDYGTVLCKRVSMTVDDATTGTSYMDFVGRYLVLLTCQVTAGTSSTTVGVQLRYGMASDPNFIPCTERFIENSTMFHTIELGEISIPSDSYSVNGVQNTTLQVWAERLSGTGVLNMERLILIPSHHLIVLDDMSSNLGTVAPPSGKASVQTLEDGRQYTLRIKSDFASDGHVSLTARDWEYPIGGGIMVFASDSAGRAGTASIELTGYRRHRTHRG